MEIAVNVNSYIYDKKTNFKKSKGWNCVYTELAMAMVCKNPGASLFYQFKTLLIQTK